LQDREPQRYRQTHLDDRALPGREQLSGPLHSRDRIAKVDLSAAIKLVPFTFKAKETEFVGELLDLFFRVAGFGEGEKQVWPRIVFDDWRTIGAAVSLGDYPFLLCAPKTPDELRAFATRLAVESATPDSLCWFARIRAHRLSSFGIPQERLNSVPKRTAKPMTWEEQFQEWAKPPGITEQTKCENAERACRKAIAASAPLAGHSVSVIQTSPSHRAQNSAGAGSCPD